MRSLPARPADDDHSPIGVLPIRERSSMCALVAGVFSPAVIATGSRFSGRAGAQVANGVYAQGRFVARLKSIVSVRSAAGAG
jgi:hypothetical protein